MHGQVAVPLSVAMTHVVTARHAQLPRWQISTEVTGGPTMAYNIAQTAGAVTYCE